MTPEQIEIYNKAAELGTIPDDLNPLFLFATTHSHLLLRIAAGEIDALALVKRELEARGITVSKANNRLPNTDRMVTRWNNRKTGSKRKP